MHFPQPLHRLCELEVVGVNGKCLTNKSLLCNMILSLSPSIFLSHANIPHHPSLSLL